MSETNIESLLPGVFYRKPAPDQPPYVEVGDEVVAGQTIGLVEIMKQYSEITAPSDGTLTKFLVEDNAMLDPGAAVAILQTEEA
ncbi:acetyl-CoA carboxylase [Pseudoclavibacter sp. CFCC 11306]|uniref:acetyl-CoA carboxylase n=1 Tax=Pseudoclavibacter sp. CFCC 11306 TaxID=1564493 RepID=UPI00130180EB|nr:acetyl-CoA carboxylase [Pseudoclavibacter sp. CFCC 11306]KAB1658862.1 biotin carboxyl carrier domain-containing protein [Pseudoclavibacter sp. CFCC 11306]